MGTLIAERNGRRTVSGEQGGADGSGGSVAERLEQAARSWSGARMLKDILGQAWEAMVYNRRRTAITMIGMAWGIATVVLLLAYGAGFSRAIEAIFAQWGTNIIGVFPGRTSEQAGGDKVRCAGAIHARRCGPDHRQRAGNQSHLAGGLQRRDGAERSAFVYVDGERCNAGLPGHLEAGYRCRAASSTGWRSSSGRMSA